MTSVSFAVQAHPARAVLAETLAGEIGAEVVYDPEPDAYLKSPWRSFQHLLATTPDWATHRVQVQDDAIVCPGFADAVTRALPARPDRLLILYVGRNAHSHAQRVMAACDRDETWAELDTASWCPTVATVWPRRLIDELFAYVEENPPPARVTADDAIVGKFLQATGERPLACVPSLVEHRDDEPSLMNRMRRGRVAACYVGDCGDCVERIDWTTGAGAAPIPRTPIEAI